MLPICRNYSEGLPNLVEQFQQRLHKHTAQSLSVIQDKLNANREEIIDRIDMINQYYNARNLSSAAI